jgi:hypothetical protein
MKRFVLAGLTALLLFELAYFGHTYIIHAPVTQAAARHNEMKDLSLYMMYHAGEYDAVYAPTIAHLPLHYLFHATIFDRSLAGKFGEDSVLTQVGNVYFNAEQCPSDFLNYALLPKKVLIIDRVECGTKLQLKTLVTIKRADGHDAYTIKAFSGK